jgi:hypothetical protein
MLENAMIHFPLFEPPQGATSLRMATLFGRRILILGLTPPGLTMSPPFGGYDRFALSEPVPSASPGPSTARSGSLAGRA